MPQKTIKAQKSDEAILFEDVWFSYGSTPIIEKASFNVHEKEMISIVGPNGGGKTTLLKLMLGLIKPDKGNINVLGQTVENGRKHIGYMPQHLQFDPLFPVTVKDIVLMGRLGKRLGGRYTQDDRRIVQSILEELDILEFSHHLFSDLSGGQRQRALIARALTCEPEILLLDEPTANVDVAAEARVFDIIRRLNDRMTILIVSHDLGFVSNLVKRVICVNRTVVVHPTSEISGEIIQEVYGGNLRMIRHDHKYQEGYHNDGIH
ncbi:ABC transporter ATP-binding protein [bacterium]|nr:ABC transporter ATP-binding protein [candidate division CSSED10-310 bacterium]